MIFSVFLHRNSYLESEGNVEITGRSQDFSKWGGGGGHTGSNNIVIAFSPRYIVGCLLKKAYKGGSRAPQDPPSYAHE